MERALGEGEGDDSASRQYQGDEWSNRTGRLL